MNYLKTITCLAILISTQFVFGDADVPKNLVPENLPEPITVIKAGSHTAEQNEQHKKACAENGATDVTDLSDIKVTSGVMDVVICFKTTADTSVPNITLAAHAPYGNAGKIPYYIRGYVDYEDAPVGTNMTMRLGVPDDNCQATSAVNIPSPKGSGSMGLNCSYSGKSSVQSYMQGVLQGVQSTNYGTIIH